MRASREGEVGSLIRPQNGRRLGFLTRAKGARAPKKQHEFLERIYRRIAVPVLQAFRRLGLRNPTARIACPLARRAVTAVRYRKTERVGQGDVGKKMRHRRRRMAEQALLLLLLDCGRNMHNA